ncbi:MAG: hypothetical protein KA010_04435 [Saprospiraceae bacterium]|nr:hypothetical protein [Saprospiraceae bacterium]
MKEYRITKYNPIFRNEKGHYLKDEWTDVSDVGKIFDGKQLTENDYLVIEKAYIASVFTMLAISNLDHLRIVGLWPENISERLSLEKDRWYFESGFESIVLIEDHLVLLSELELVLKLIFRGTISCRLEVYNQFYVHFGYDYYMYIGGKEISDIALAEISSSGLFIEPYGSPYFSRLHKWFLQWCNINDFIVIDQVEIPFMNVELVRKCLHLSSEHPADISFEITPDNVEILQNEFNVDFGRYSYSVSCEGVIE